MSSNRNIKRRYSAAKIAKTPSLKKKLANFIARYDLKKQQYDMTDMLAYGHRGYISYDEKELCKIFDEIYGSLIAKELAIQEKIAAAQKEKVNSNHVSYKLQSLERELNQYRNIEMVEAKTLADEIFEKEVLG